MCDGEREEETQRAAAIILSWETWRTSLFGLAASSEPRHATVAF